MIKKETTSSYWVDTVQVEAGKWHEKHKTYSFSRIPNALFEYAGILDLSTSELGFLCMLLHHMRYKKSDGKPTRIYPSLSRLSDYKISADRRTLSSLAHSLQEKGLVQIIKETGKSNTYDPSGLFAILLHLVAVDEDIQDRLKHEYIEGNIKDRQEADDYRFKELGTQLTIRKRRLGLI